MAYVITEPCIGTKDSACVDVCPVDCIHPRKDEPAFESAKMLNIHPDECIDCGACVPACPVEAIFALDEVPEKWKDYITENATYFKKEVARQRQKAKLLPFALCLGMLYLDFDRAAWSALRAATPLTLGAADLVELQGLNESVSLEEVGAIYLPLSRLLNLHVAATQTLHKASDTFLGALPAPTPYVIGIAGSVAVGKSTFARVLRALLARWPAHPRVDLVTTDGFLLPNRVLEARGLMHRKGFPESYDVRRLVQFMADIKAAAGAVSAPVYSHQAYDIVPDQLQIVDRPDIVIVEGLNVLQTGDGHAGRPARVFVSDFFDFSIYIDADEADVEAWYVARFLRLRETIFRDPASYFHRYAALSDDDAVRTAREIWRTINGVNLRENITPTRERARLILEKGADHAVRRVRLRRA